MMNLLFLVGCFFASSVAQTDCCSPCGTGFCPRLNGVFGCTQTNGACTDCQSNGACSSTAASCRTRCPAAATTTPSSSSGGGSQWNGDFKLQNTCGSTCCCVDRLILLQSGTTVTASGITIVGQCNGATTLPSTSGTLSSSSATSVTFSFGGQTQTATLSGDTISTVNAQFPQCNTQLARASTGAAPCFHKDTVITYAGKDHTFDQIRVHPECSIPHVVSAHGVIVKAKCGVSEKTLRLTDGHLVYTQRGLQAAGDLKPGQDTVYADLAETTSCHVVSVTKESQQHDYFGLNCLNSQVLASGLKSSTFEKLHSIPAFWMQVIGRVLGVKRASQLGDYIGEIVQQMNLI